MKKMNFINKPNLNKRIQTAGRRKDSEYSFDSAAEAALDYVGVQKKDINHCAFISADGMYEILFSTDWLHYDIFVNCITGEVDGCNFEPVTMNFTMGIV